MRSRRRLLWRVFKRCRWQRILRLTRIFVYFIFFIAVYQRVEFMYQSTHFVQCKWEMKTESGYLRRNALNIWHGQSQVSNLIFNSTLYVRLNSFILLERSLARVSVCDWKSWTNDFCANILRDTKLQPGKIPQSSVSNWKFGA